MKNLIQKYGVITCVIILSLTGCIIIFSFTNHFATDNHYVLLANNFLKGSLEVGQRLMGDEVLFNGKYYLYFGPLPAVLLMPMVKIFGINSPQNALTIITALFSFILCVKIAQKYGFNKQNALWIASLYIFGTVYTCLVLVNITAFQVQAIANFFLIGGLYMWINQKKYFLAGVYIALAEATRINLVGASVFFIIIILLENITFREKMAKLTFFLMPIFIMTYYISFYNYFRFDNFLETGYAYNITFPYTANVEDGNKYGIFSIHHVPKNLYYFLAKGPEWVISGPTQKPQFPFIKASEWGLSILITSPLLILPFLSRKIKKCIPECIAILVIAIPIFTYYGIGFSQFGYRYALDFYPFLLLVFLKHTGGKVTTLSKILIIYSITFNLLFMLSIWGKYPLFGITN